MKGHFAITLFPSRRKRFENAMRQPRSIPKAGLLRHLHMEQDQSVRLRPFGRRPARRAVAEGHSGSWTDWSGCRFPTFCLPRSSADKVSRPVCDSLPATRRSLNEPLLQRSKIGNEVRPVRRVRQPLRRASCSREPPSVAISNTIEGLASQTMPDFFIRHCSGSREPYPPSCRWFLPGPVDAIGMIRRGHAAQL